MRRRQHHLWLWLAKRGAGILSGCAAKLLGSSYQVGNFGVNGAAVQHAAGKPYWTLPKMKDAEAFAPQIVVVMRGSNDANLKNWNAAAFAKDYAEFLAHWQALPGKPKVLSAVPVPAYGQAFSIQPAVVEMEIPPLLKQAAEAAKVTIIDTFGAVAGKPELFHDKRDRSFIPCLRVERVSGPACRLVGAVIASSGRGSVPAPAYRCLRRAG